MHMYSADPSGDEHDKHPVEEPKEPGSDGMDVTKTDKQNTEDDVVSDDESPSEAEESSGSSYAPSSDDNDSSSSDATVIYPVPKSMRPPIAANVKKRKSVSRPSGPSQCQRSAPGLEVRIQNASTYNTRRGSLKGRQDRGL